MIIAKFNKNIKLCEVDEFVTMFTKKFKNKDLEIDVKLTDTECLIYFCKKFN